MTEIARPEPSRMYRWIVLIFISVFLIAFVFVKGFGARVEEGRPGG